MNTERKRQLKREPCRGQTPSTGESAAHLIPEYVVNRRDSTPVAKQKTSVTIDTTRGQTPAQTPAHNNKGGIICVQRTTLTTSAKAV